MTKTATAVSPTESIEYKRALAAQMDYDSTPPGQKALEQALANPDLDPTTRRGLTARKVSGERSREYRREQVGMMVPVVKRGEPGWREYSALAEKREELARDLACAAAETHCWGKPYPGTVETIVTRMNEVLEAEAALGVERVSWRHPHVLAADPGKALAPWLRANLHRDVHVGDAAFVTVLGMENAQFREGRVYATGDPDGVYRWGYLAQRDGDVTIISKAPDVVAWSKARAAG